MRKLSVLAILLAIAGGVAAKDIKTITVTTQPLMHCESCEKKIKGNLRFEKGVKKIETNVKAQRVVVTYDAEKTTPERIVQSFQKFGYTATELKTAAAGAQKETKQGK